MHRGAGPMKSAPGTMSRRHNGGRRPRVEDQASRLKGFPLASAAHVLPAEGTPIHQRGERDGGLAPKTQLSPGSRANPCQISQDRNALPPAVMRTAASGDIRCGAVSLGGDLRQQGPIPSTCPGAGVRPCKRQLCPPSLLSRLVICTCAYCVCTITRVRVRVTATRRAIELYCCEIGSIREAAGWRARCTLNNEFRAKTAPSQVRSTCMKREWRPPWDGGISCQAQCHAAMPLLLLLAVTPGSCACIACAMTPTWEGGRVGAKGASNFPFRASGRPTATGPGVEKPRWAPRPLSLSHPCGAFQNRRRYLRMRMGLKGKTGALPPSCQKDEPSLDISGGCGYGCG